MLVFVCICACYVCVLCVRSILLTRGMCKVGMEAFRLLLRLNTAMFDFRFSRPRLSPHHRPSKRPLIATVGMQRTALLPGLFQSAVDLLCRHSAGQPFEWPHPGPSFERVCSVALVDCPSTFSATCIVGTT